MSSKKLYISTDLKHLNELTNYTVDKNKSIKVQLESANKAYSAANTAFKDHDEERAYVLYMRYLDIITKLRNTRDFKKSEHIYKDYYKTSELLVAMDKSEQLSKSLQRRYSAAKSASQEKKETKMPTQASLLAINGHAAEKNAHEPVKEEKPADVLDGIKGSIDIHTLYKLCFVKNRKVLIMDIRNEQDYKESHMQYDLCVNVPNTAIMPGAVCAKIEAGLNKTSQLMWNNRDQAELVVLLDWHSKVERLETISDPLRSLKDSLWKWDHLKKLNREPVILQEGYADFLEMYPQFTTNAKVKPPSNKPKTGNVNSLLDFSYNDLRSTITRTSSASNPTHSPERKVDSSRALNKNKPQLDGANLKMPSDPVLAVKKVVPQERKHSIGETANSSKHLAAKPAINRSVKPKLTKDAPEVKPVAEKDQQPPAPTTKTADDFAEKEVDPIESEHQKVLESNRSLQKEIDEIQHKTRLIELQKAKELEEKQMEIKREAERELANKMRSLKKTSVSDSVSDTSSVAPKTPDKQPPSTTASVKPGALKRNEGGIDVKALRAKKPLHIIDNEADRQRKSFQHSKENKSDDATFKQSDMAFRAGAGREATGGRASSSSSSLKRSFSSPNVAKLVDKESVAVVPRMPSRSCKPVMRDDSSEFIIGLTRSLDGVYGSTGRALCGLKNLGNSCYMNSILQCMFNTTELAEYFLTNAYRRDLNRHNKLGLGGRLAECFSVLLRAVWGGQYKYLAPKDFKYWMGKANELFADYSQEDAQELLMALMDGLHEDLNRGSKSGKLAEEENDSLGDEEAAQLALANHKSKNDSMLHDLFLGQFKATVQCLSCGKMSKKFDIFLNLSLPMPHQRGSASMAELLDDFQRTEKMSGSNRWYCPNCKQLRDANKTIRIWKLPPVLVVHFKRFVYAGRWRDKIQTNVDFPLHGLNMDRWVCGPGQSGKRYDLYGVSHHQGAGLDSGHYVASCRSVLDGNWYKFNDHDVYRTPSPQGSTCFVLFYTSTRRSVPRQESLTTR